MALKKPELLSKDANQSPARLIDEMSRLYYLSRAIHVAAQLGIADHVGDDTVAADELAQRTGTNPAALDRLLRFLSAYGIFEEHAPVQYRNTELSAALREDHPQSVRANLRRIGEFWWSAVGILEHSIRSGESAFTAFHGVPFFRYLEDHPDVQKRFDEAMARISTADDAAIADAYDFSGFHRIVDVGGGRGGLLAQILTRVPDATGVLFEQPQVVAGATRLEQLGLSDRAELVGGDFFKAVPEGGDCYVIKGVLHDFSDEECVTVLSNCRKSMRKDARVIVANQDLPTPIAGPHPNLTMDIQMMVLLTGRERSATQWGELFRRAGLKARDSIPTEVGFTLVDGAISERG
jgi:hypothetical protein